MRRRSSCSCSSSSGRRLRVGVGVVQIRGFRNSRAVARRDGRLARRDAARPAAATASNQWPQWVARGFDDAEGALGSGVGEEGGVRGVPSNGGSREGGEVEGTARASGGAGHGAEDAHALAHPREACERARAAGTIPIAGTVGSVGRVGFGGEAVDGVRLEVGGGGLELAPRLGVRIVGVGVGVGVDVLDGAVLGSRRAGLVAGEVGAGRGIGGLGRGVARPALRAQPAASAAPLVLVLVLERLARDDVVAVAHRLEREEARGERPRVGVGVARPGPGPRPGPRRAGDLPSASGSPNPPARGRVPPPAAPRARPRRSPRWRSPPATRSRSDTSPAATRTHPSPRARGYARALAREPPPTNTTTPRPRRLDDTRSRTRASDEPNDEETTR